MPSPGEGKCFYKLSIINQKSASCHRHEAVPISGLRAILKVPAKPPVQGRVFWKPPLPRSITSTKSSF